MDKVFCCCKFQSFFEVFFLHFDYIFFSIVSCVTCHMSKYFLKTFYISKEIKKGNDTEKKIGQSGRGSVINGAYPV